MVLVHDDDLARLDGVCDTIVGRSSIQYAVVLMFSYFQPLDSLQSSVMLRHMRGLRPTAHVARIGELFQCYGVTISITNSGGAHLKDLSSGMETKSACVATLSNIFQKRGKVSRFSNFVSCPHRFS
jgi:hypothetical protein